MSQTMPRPFTFDRVVRLIITVVVICGVLWLVNILRNVLLPFFVACLIAYMFEPFVQFNRRLLHLRGRVVAIFVTLFESVFFLSVLGWFLVPMLTEEMHSMARILRNYASSEIHISFLPAGIHEFIKSQVDFAAISDMLTKQEWMSLIESVVSTTWNILTGSISLLLGIFNWFIVVLYVVFIMIDYPRFFMAIRRMVPPKYRPIVFKVGSDIKVSMNHYFRGQALVAFIVGLLFTAGFLIIGLPMAVVLGLFIGLLNMVPYLQLVSIVPTIILCMVYAAGGGGDFWSIFWQAIAVYCVVQAIQDLILTPRIMGKSMGLNPAIILLSLSVWGTLLGFIGLIIALPLTTLLLSYYDHYVIDRVERSDEHGPVMADE
ncbi:AI-2E family transporter [Paramuribaculum intestinale]|nr:AI-2E family transporter [Paramuribaculum intestinale]